MSARVPLGDDLQLTKVLGVSRHSEPAVGGVLRWCGHRACGRRCFGDISPSEGVCTWYRCSCSPPLCPFRGPGALLAFGLCSAYPAAGLCLGCAQVGERCLVRAAAFTPRSYSRHQPKSRLHKAVSGFSLVGGGVVF